MRRELGALASAGRQVRLPATHVRFWHRAELADGVAHVRFRTQLRLHPQRQSRSNSPALDLDAPGSIDMRLISAHHVVAGLIIGFPHPLTVSLCEPRHRRNDWL